MRRPACRAGCTGTRPGTHEEYRRRKRSSRRSRGPGMPERAPGRSAGTAGFLAAGGAAKRAGLAAGPRAVYQAVLRAFAATGRPPEPAELESAARRHGITAGQALATLAAADVLGLDDEGRIRMAYPFSAAPTPHLVTIAGGPLVYSMCAIDALGIP